MPNVISIAEHGVIGNERDHSGAPTDVVLVADTTFQALRHLAFDSEGIDTLLTFFVQKGREYIRVKNYVGLLTLVDGTQLEITPKVTDGAGGRAILFTMLRYLRHSPFRLLGTAWTSAIQLPVWEVFISTFLDTLESLVRQGLQQTYVSVERNERYLRGKFQPARQQRENSLHAERMAVIHDTLTADVAPNRLVKTALCYVQPLTQNLAIHGRIRQFLWALADVPVSESVTADLNAVQRMSRLFDRYKPALWWAEALLIGKGYGVNTGRTNDLSLLFPIGRVFEDYVAHGIRSYWPEAGIVTVQESSAHLVDEHVGAPKFKLRPDIIIRQSGRTFVLDTKWKQLYGHDRSGNYGIDQTDLYQLYAYGKKYQADELFLIYPANETFHKPLAVFGYDTDTRLHVVPFDLTTPLAKEVEMLASYALSFQ
jgi:5-methylcytosine-specific restriction enzyme subunit McrC